MSVYTKVCASDYEASATNPETVEINQIAACRVYKRRWMILSLFVFFSIISLMQWIQYSIIADVIVEYYGISYETADWNSMIYLLLYIPFSFPGSYFLDKMGLRVAILVGIVGTSIGAWIKVASVSPDRYWVLLVGQSFVAISEVFILPVSPRLAAVWFGANEVSSACSIGVFGSQVGIALGFLLPPLLVNNRMPKNVIENNLFTMSLAVAIACSILMLVLFLLFQAAPPTPPSVSQLQIQKKENSTFTQSLKKMILNPSFVLLLLAYGINIGINYTISMLLNQIILKYHPDATTEAGVVGLIIIVFGTIGSLVGGIILDKCNRYRETTLATYALSLTSMIAFTFVISTRMEVIYFVSALLGFSMCAVLTIGLELGVELTYPEPEGTSGGLLTTSAQLFGIIFTYLYSFLFNEIGDIWANLTMSVLLFVGTLFIFFLRFDLRRQKAQKIIDLCH